MKKQDLDSIVDLLDSAIDKINKMRTKCKGKNCLSIGGFNHSKECIREHEIASSPYNLLEYFYIGKLITDQKNWPDWAKYKWCDEKKKYGGIWCSPGGEMLYCGKERLLEGDCIVRGPKGKIYVLR